MESMPHLRRRYPGLRLYLREDLTARLLERLGMGDLDVALIALPWHADDIETLVIGQDSFVLACPPDHPLATRGNLRSTDLIGQDLLLLEEGHCLRDHALAACHLPGPAKGEGVLGTSLPTLVQMVANGLGVTLLPEMAVRGGVLGGTDLVIRPVADAGSRQIGLAWRPSSPRKTEYRLLGEALKQGFHAASG